MNMSAKHYLKIFINLVIAIIATLLVIFVLPRIIVFFMPFVVGWIISLLANPLVQLLEKHLKIRRKAGSAFTIIIVIILVALLLYGIFNFLFQQASGFIENLPQMWESIENDLSNIGDKFQIIYNKMPLESQQQIDNVTDNVNSYIGNIIGKLSSPTVQWVSNFAMNVPSVLVAIVMGLLSAYFFVADKAYINQFLQKFMPLAMKKKWNIVRNSIKQAFGGYLLAQLKIEIWMYLLLVIGLYIAGMKYAALIALGIAFLDLLPVLGTGTVLVPWAIIKMIGGNYTTAVILLVLWGGGQLLRQLIQPHFVGNSIGLPSLPTLFLLYIGWKLSGVLGMILAVPVGLVLMNLYKEGAFNTTKDSISMLIRDIDAFRKYDSNDYTYYINNKDKKKQKRNIVQHSEIEKHNEINQYGDKVQQKNKEHQ